MKAILLSLLVLLVSCGQEVPSWDKLSEVEKEYIRELAKTQCLADFGPFYEDFKVTSGQYFGSATYVRGATINWSYKTGGSGGTEIFSGIFSVWKTTPSAVYFRVTEKMPANSSYFLKISLTENTAMIEQLKQDQCRRYYKSGTDASPSVIKNFYDVSSPPLIDEITDDITFNHAYPAWLSAWQVNRSVREKNIDGTYTNSNNKDYVSSFSETSVVFPTPTYSDATQYTQAFCEMNTTNYNYSLTKDQTIGYKKLVSCVTAPPAWVSELAPPF